MADVSHVNIRIIIITTIISTMKQSSVNELFDRMEAGIIDQYHITNSQDTLLFRTSTLKTAIQVTMSMDTEGLEAPCLVEDIFAVGSRFNGWLHSKVVIDLVALPYGGIFADTDSSSIACLYW